MFLHHLDPEWPTYKEAATAWVAASRAAGLQTLLPCYDKESARALAIFNMDADRRNGDRAMLDATRAGRGLPVAPAMKRAA